MSSEPSDRLRFSCADFPVNELSDSDTTITFNDMGDVVPEEPPSPEPLSDCIPELNFASTSPILHELRNIPSTCYLVFHTLNLGLQLSHHANHT